MYAEVVEDLLEVIGDRSQNTIIDWSNFCGKDYRKWEGAVKAVLQTRGYRVERFFNLEADSFGPLFRGVDVIDPKGNRRTLAYG